MSTPLTNVIRYGRPEPLTETQRFYAGPLKVEFEEGALRRIYCNDMEIVRGIYVAVRDHDWGTIPGQLSALHAQQTEHGFRITFVSEHRAGDIDFFWTGTISGSDDGTVTFEMEGEARSTFRKNRIGFCILHPMEFAGMPVTVFTTDGCESGKFPEYISPHQPFFQMTGMYYELNSGIAVDMRFEGDIFEMEDQRNWTDASYKTYCTPLGLPFPVTVEKGQRIQQRVRLHVQVKIGDVVPQIDSTTNEVQVQVSSLSLRTVPKLGLGYSGPDVPEAAIYRIRQLRLDYLHIYLDLTRSLNWSNELENAIRQAELLDTRLNVEVVVADNGEGLAEVMQYLASRSHPVTHLFIFSAKTYVSSSDLLRKAKSLAKHHHQSLIIGGGTCAFFTEFNRAKLPLSDMEAASYTLNPQVHAFDNRSLLETLPAQAETVKTARRTIGHTMPLIVGPITFKMHLNPNATSGEPIPFEDTVDPRQRSLFGAAWTVGSLQSLMSSETDAVTYFELFGPRGIMDADGVFPMYHVFRDVMELDEAEVLDAQVSDNMSVGVLALRHGNQIRAILANYRNDQTCVYLRLPTTGDVFVRYLDENTYYLSRAEPDKFHAHQELIHQATNEISLKLNPFGLACVEVK